MPLYTPISGSWLNMAESVQRIIVPRALDGQHPQSQDDLITWLDDTVAGWNADPTPVHLARQALRATTTGASTTTGRLTQPPSHLFMQLRHDPLGGWVTGALTHNRPGSADSETTTGCMPDDP